MRLPRDTEGGGDAFAGDVVVGRADAAGGEHVIEFLPDFVHRADDRFGDVGNDPDLPQRDTQIAQTGRQELDVGVAGAAGQHLVADDQQAGGGIFPGHGIVP